MAPLSTSELKDILEWTTLLARKAGKIMLEGSQAIQIAAASEDTGVNEKKNSVDLVTEYDVKVEELVKKEIREKYPSFKLYVLILVLASVIEMDAYYEQLYDICTVGFTVLVKKPPQLEIVHL